MAAAAAVAAMAAPGVWASQVALEDSVPMMQAQAARVALERMAAPAVVAVAGRAA